MADSIISQITQSLKTSLVNLSTMGRTVEAVELERYFMKVNGRYPYISISGPQFDIDFQTYRLGVATLSYEIRLYIDDINDESETANTEITYVVRNVCADMQKAICTDKQRNSLALTTKVTGGGYDFSIIEDDVEFYVYITAEVMARIDSSDPYKLG